MWCKEDSSLLRFLSVTGGFLFNHSESAVNIMQMFIHRQPLDFWLTEEGSFSFYVNDKGLSLVHKYQLMPMNQPHNFVDLVVSKKRRTWNRCDMRGILCCPPDVLSLISSYGLFVCLVTKLKQELHRPTLLWTHYPVHCGLGDSCRLRPPQVCLLNLV